MLIFIPTSGLGSRLGGLTKYTNKALLKIGDKPAISHIIDLYPDGEFVIALGYLGDYVKQFLELAYPDKKFEFVYVDPYEGSGSSLLKSMSFAENNLQSPFIFNTCDTILTKAPPPPFTNWMACARSNKPDVFRTVSINKDNIIKINEKGEMNYDYAYTGVAGIYNYSEFWAELNNIIKINSSTDLSDCHVFMNLLSNFNIKLWVVDDWHDTGTVETLNKTRRFFNREYNVLDKHEEAIYFLDDNVIKFFSDSSLCKNRVRRSTLLTGLIPKIISSSDNFYKYEFVQGKLLSHVITENRLECLLDWAEKNLWLPSDIISLDFKIKCKHFYIDKTNQRLENYFEQINKQDECNIINNIEIPKYKDIFNKIDWERLCSSQPTMFHGDFILDNILYKDDGFILLDWRQDFSGEIAAGDRYYDLAKFNHNLIFNHDIVSDNCFSIEFKNEMIFCDIHRSHNLTIIQQKFIDLLEKRGYDLYKIKILTPLIWLNMAPLHLYPLNKFLFYFGKYNLWRELCSCT